MAPGERDAFQEIVARRAEGGSDEDLQYVVDAMPFPGQTFAPLHDREHKHHHHGEQDHAHEHAHGHDEAHRHGPTKDRSRRKAWDSGWA